MDAAAISDVEQAEQASQWSARQQDNAALEMPPALLELKKTGILEAVDKQLQIVAYAAAALIATALESASPEAHEVAVPRQNEHRVLHESSSGKGLRLVIVMGVLFLALGLGWFGLSNLSRYFDFDRDELSSRAAINAVVERIIGVESNGDPDAKNNRSSAAGPGQFLNETWLELMRTYRPDLARARSESKILELRRDTKLVREIATRFVERNASMLRQRGLPVTAGTVYLAHFAGGAGAVAILSAKESADAGLVMARADATGRTTREQIIKANPFLEHFTVADLRVWADRKMRGPSFQPIYLMNLRPAQKK
jgi:hypothetical protein